MFRVKENEFSQLTTYLSLSCEMYRRLDKLARKASTITESIVKPAFKHLEQQWTENMLKQPKEKNNTIESHQLNTSHCTTVNAHQV